jgi:hypothetical protein
VPFFLPVAQAVVAQIKSHGPGEPGLTSPLTGEFCRRLPHGIHFRIYS